MKSRWEDFVEGAASALIGIALFLIPVGANAWWQSIQQAAISTASYQGPGDVVTSATAWGSCARVYNLAAASTSTSLCDLVAVTGGAVVCTLRGTSSGLVDLAASYCAGTTPSAACAAATGGSCKVTKVYDQTGNTNHWTNVTLASMPALTFSAVNGLPGMSFVAGSNTILTNVNSLSLTQPIYTEGAAKRTASGAVGAILGAGTGTLFEFGWTASASTGLVSENVGSVTAAATDGSFNALQGIFNNGATNSVLTVNGADTTGDVGTASAITNAIRIGRANACCTPTAIIMEAGVWSATTVNSGTRTSMDTNIRSATNGYNF